MVFRIGGRFTAVVRPSPHGPWTAEDGRVACADSGAAVDLAEAALRCRVVAGQLYVYLGGAAANQQPPGA